MIKKNFSKAIVNLVLLLLACMCIMPIFIVISISVSKISDIHEYGYRFIPTSFSLDAYKYIFSSSGQIIGAYLVTLRVVLIGTILGVTIMAMFAYAISRSDFRYRRQFSFFVFFTMLFSAGLVPSYILITNYLNLKNTIWVLILPYVANAWHIMMLRSFFTSLPDGVLEAARIDGCSEFRTFWTIAVPMSTPALATVALLTVLRFWNEWFAALMYIDKDNLIPLQYLLYRTMSNLDELNRQAMEMGAAAELGEFPSESVRMAMAAASSVPVLMVFPFFQKYFCKGLTVGAVKG